MNDRKFEELLDRELKDLKRDIAPPRDLWPGIDHAINGGGRRLFSPVALAASVVLAVALAVSGGLYFNTPEQSATSVSDFIALLQSEHEKNKQSLLVQYQDQTPLAPDWEAQMQQLEQAEQVIYQALREDPENIELLKILRQVQTKQIELIESVYAPMFKTI